MSEETQKNGELHTNEDLPEGNGVRVENNPLKGKKEGKKKGRRKKK